MQSFIRRTTKETDIALKLEILNGKQGSYSGNCGVGFFDHMLNSFCVHGGFAIELEMQGDLEVDCHHSIEDLGIVLGKAFHEALTGENLSRFGQSYIPMDESLSRAVIDISGRPYLVFDAVFDRQYIGEFDTSMVREFFYAFTYSAGVTLHLANLYGSNDHHKVESLFKAFARALGQAVTPKNGAVLSTKGMLE